MQESALVLLDPGNGRPLPVVENTAGVDENVGEVANGVARDVVADLDVVTVLLGVPEGADDLVLSLDVALETILVRETVKVGEDLCCGRVDS